MQISDMKDMRKSAAQRLSSGEETPWDWYQLMKLREALDALIETAETRATHETAVSPEELSTSGKASPTSGRRTSAEYRSLINDV